jgi:hypothetical protein
MPALQRRHLECGKRQMARTIGTHVDDLERNDQQGLHRERHDPLAETERNGFTDRANAGASGR